MATFIYKSEFIEFQLRFEMSSLPTDSETFQSVLG